MRTSKQRSAEIDRDGQTVYTAGHEETETQQDQDKLNTTMRTTDTSYNPQFTSF